MSVDAPDATAAVQPDPRPLAASLTTVGYSYFALMQQGPLSDIKSIGDLVNDLGVEARAAAAAAAPRQPTQQELNESVVAELEDALDEIGSAKPAQPAPTAQPRAPRPVTQQGVSADVAAEVVAMTKDIDTEAAVTEPETTPSARKEPERAQGQKQALSAKATMELLKEISFLDE